MKPNAAIKEIDMDLLRLLDIKSMTAKDALNYANDVVKKVNEVIASDSVDDKATLYALYRKAERAYILAGKRTVPKDERDEVSYPSGFWGMRAKETRVRRIVEYRI